MWKIKDPELKAKVNQFFTDKEIREENVLTVSLSSGKYMEFKDFPESEWKRLRETLGFTEKKE